MLCWDGAEQCLNDRHILVPSNQQTRAELKGQLCALWNTGKLSEMKSELLISACFTFEPISLRPNSHWTVGLQPNYYRTISQRDILCHGSFFFLFFLSKNLMKTLGSSPAHSTAICIAESKAAPCSHTSFFALLLVGTASHHARQLTTANFTRRLANP